ncbi:hypothetical protein [Microbulbifer sp.]|uniref:hypothetical protein n=1 Tax=Microbulbifer sp. TaxID=1908541 RepID=UPI0025891C85|nr:hypothetical protein [Microbulbifer sp.]
MNNHNLLKRVLISLKAVKASIRDTAEPSVSEQLDQAICEIQRLIDDEESEKRAHSKALVCLGKVFDKLPSVVALIKLFSG